MQFARVNGVVLHHALTGTPGKPLLVFANSLGTDFRTWQGVSADLAPDFSLLFYDKRGHGLSEAPEAPYRIEDHIGDLAALMDHLGTGPAVIVGLSVGGIIAQGLSAARPDLVRALILCDTAHKIGPPEMWNQRIASIEAGGIEALADPIMERWFSKSFREGRPDEIAGWRAMLTRTPLQGYLGTCAAIRDADMTGAAKAIPVPAFCLVGSEDGATPPDLVRATAELIPGAGFTVIEGVGHLPCVEAAQEVSGIIRRFVKEQGLG